ncbi:retrotransposon gag protein [Cucumis melo var. makuwa]|uniref:Retrotransposon gag protein n=1 Tax=Cucumis melo var. makuwa TaxID=1194695 RepID=A0A5A7UJ60_CUCMM|nr:retrotransposon gag protein [Cucumis melo var. makuwa]TYK25786.1 retrotransposon gag protein [Cucumis melo var. makuwa]
MESSKAGIVLKENPLYDNSDSASSKSKKKAHPGVMSVMMTDITIEAAMAEMQRKIDLSMKVVEERDHEITALREQMRTRKTVESSQTPVIKATDKGKNCDGKGNPKQNIAHFVKTCENTKSRGDQLVRQFVGSLKGNAFKWYTDLEPEVIDSWEQLEKEFLNHFYSTRQLSAIEMCTQGMCCGLLNIIQGIKPSITSRGTKDFPIPEERKDKKEMKGAEKMVKSTVKESMVEKQLIQLPECKRPEQAGKVDDPNFCKYHRVISHPIEKYFMLKELILRLAREKKIELDLEEVAQTNHAAVTIMKLHLRILKKKERSIEEDDKGWIVVTRRKKRKSTSTQTQKESRFYRNYRRGNKTQKNKKKKKTRKPKLGSVVDIMPKSTMRQLDILMDELSNSKLVIQGFNQGSQRVIGMIRLELIINDLKASALFHVIDSRTTYKLLLSRSWIHGSGVVMSTLHQGFKFYQDDVKKVEPDSNPFSKAESHFADAKFYLKNDNSPEAMPVEIPLVNKEDNLQLKSLVSMEPHENTRTFNSGKGEASPSTTKSMILMDEKTLNPSILCYVPLSRCKKGESPFVETPQGLNVGDIEVLKESFT